jgi:S1-C subfamily serine protease
MEKYRWLIVILGVAALFIALVFSAAFGAGITYFFLQAEPARASSLGLVSLEEVEGVLVSNVKPESSAAKAGLVRGDIILKVNDQPVNHIIELKAVFADLKPGEIVELTVLHGDDTHTLEIELDDSDGFAFLGVGTCDFPMDKKAFPNGSMEDGFIESFFVSAEILEIVPGSPAEAAGLQVGDRIISVDRKPIGPKMDLADLIQKHEPGDTVMLEVLPELDEGTTEVKLILGENPDQPSKAYLGVIYQMGAPINLENGDNPFEKLFPFGEIPEGFKGEDGLPHFFFHHGEEFNGELPEGWDQEMMPNFFQVPILPEGIEGAVIISEVVEGTPAADAGLEPGDFVIAIDGEPVEDIESFVENLQLRIPGDEVSLTIIRNEEQKNIQVTLTEHPDNPEMGYLGVLAGTFSVFEEMVLPEGLDQDFEFELPGVPGGDV